MLGARWDQARSALANCPSARTATAAPGPAGCAIFGTLDTGWELLVATVVLTMGSMNSERREQTTMDYLRQHGLLVAVVTVVCAAAALGVSLLQTPSFSAEAAVSVRDPTQDLTLLGASSSSNATPDVLAAAHVPQVTRPSVAQRVKADLHSYLTPGQAAPSVNVHVDPTSNLVLIDANAPHAAEAAAIANAFAQEDANQSTQEARQTFARAASSLAKKIRSLGAANNATTRLIYIDQLSRLQSLSAVAVPVEVSSAATVPGAPSSPQPVRNTLVGIFLGLLLGFAAAYGRRALDRQLRHPDEIEQCMGLPLLGAVRKEALGRAGAVSNGRGPAEDVDLESFRILRQNVEYLDVDQTVRCIVVTSPMAQEGKTTVAAGLAIASAAVGKLTVLLECDLRRPVLAARFGLADNPGLTDYLAGNATPEQVLQVVSTSRATGLFGEGETTANDLTVGEGRKLVCITAGTVPLRPAELLGSTQFQTLLSELREVYEVIILDSCPLLPVADTLELVPYVSDIVICVRCDQTTRNEAEAAKACLGRLPAKPAGVVATGLRRRDAGYYGYSYEAYSATRTPA